MATAANNGQTLGGYELDFVDIPPGCECAICQLPMKDPLIIKSCGHRFCNVCLQPVLRQKPSLCPLDRQPIVRDKVTLDVEWKTKITSLPVLCPNKGCEWVGELAKLESHEREHCEFPQVCPYIGCKMRLNYLTYSVHLKSCNWRTINCNSCKQDFSLCQLREHTAFCRSGTRSQLTCVCGMMFPTKEQMAQHEIVGCPFKRSVSSVPSLNLAGVIPCPFAIFGCPAKIRPCDIDSHYISFGTLHLWFTANTVDKIRVVLETTKKQTEFAATTLGFLREELQKNAKETQELKESSQTWAREMQELKDQLNSINNTIENQDSTNTGIEENQSFVKENKDEQNVTKTLVQEVKEIQDTIKAINEAIADLQGTNSDALETQGNVSWQQMSDKMKVKVQHQDIEKMKDQISALQRQVLQSEKSRPHMASQISALQEQVLQIEKSGPHIVNDDCSRKIESQSKNCNEAQSRLGKAIEAIREELGVLSARSFKMESKFLDHEENTFCWHKQTKELLKSRTNENSKLFEAIQKELKELNAVKDEHSKKIQQYAAIQEKLTAACRAQDEQTELVRKNINEIADTLGMPKESTRPEQDLEPCKTITKNSDGKGKASRKTLHQNQTMTEIHEEIDALKNELKSVRGEFELYMLNNSENNLFLSDQMQKQIDVLSILASQRLDKLQEQEKQQKDKFENCESHFGLEKTMSQDFETKQQTIGYAAIANQPLQGECNGHAKEQETFVNNVFLDVSTKKRMYKENFAKHLEDIERAVAALMLTDSGPNKKDRIKKHSEDHTLCLETVKDVTELKHSE